MPDYPDADLQGVTELRIHGVSGTPVESMLQHPHPVQVSGDKLAGFYRRGDAAQPEKPTKEPDQRLEAYSWGRLTAGASARALWLLLLPFALVNVASWAHPVRPRETFTPVGTMSSLLRVFALTITGTVVLGTASITLDLFAWQCGNDVTRCASEHWFTAFMEKGLWSREGIRIVVGALVPLVIVDVLRRLSKSTAKAYEEYEEHLPDEDPSTDAGPPAGARVVHASDGAPLPGATTSGTSCGAADFAKPKFWSGGKPLRRLRSLHTGAAFAAVAAVVSYTVRHRGHAEAAGTVLLAAALAVIALAVLLAVSPYSGRRKALFKGEDPPKAVCLAFDLVQWGGTAVAVASLVHAAGYATDEDVSGIVPGLHRAIDLLLWSQIYLLGALLLVSVWALVPFGRTFGESLARRPMFGGFTEWVLGLLALGVAGAYVSGVAFRVADYLGRPVPSDTCTDGPCPSGSETAFGVPPQHYWAGRVFALLVVSVVAAVIVVFAIRWARRKRYQAQVRQEYGIPADDKKANDRVDAIAKAQRAAGMTDWVDLVVGSVLVLTLVLTLVLWNFDENLDKRHFEFVTTAGTWLVSIFALGVVVVGRSAYRNQALRRTVGIVWDLATFWPRAAHPFAPPCYCERTVPELRRRIGRLLDAGGRVVISAHSQGSVIAAAAVLQLPEEGRDRVGLLTYGCPLDRLYARAFPHYFGAASLGDVRTAIGSRWRNLFRRTDPIGGPVFARDEPVLPPAAPDRRLTDPAFAKDAYEFTWPRSRGHSDYPHDPRFEQTVTEVAGLLPAP